MMTPGSTLFPRAFPSLGARRPRRAPAAWTVLTGIGLLATISIVLAWQPFLAAGAVVGGLLVWVTFTWPLAVIGVMLALGPLDLSFVTGGFKELFPELGGLDMNGIRLVGVSAGLALVVATDRELIRTVTLPRTIFYVIFMGYAAATLAWSPDRLEGLRLLFKLAYPLLVFIVVAAPERTPEQVERLATWTLVGATAIVLLNPAFVLANGFERDIEGRLRVGGAGIHQNPFSFYLLIVVLLSAARFAVRGQARYLLLAGLASVWMALTLTRITLGAALLGLVGMSLYGALINRNYRGAAAGLGLAGLLAIALAPVVLARSFGYVPSAGELLQLAGDPVALFNAVNWQGRQLIWPVLMQAWASSPWIGLGLGASPSVLDAALPGLAIIPHNEYLRLGVEAGWVGVTLFFLAIATWLRMVLRAGRAGPPSVREHALPALAGTLAWAVIAATDNAFDYYGPFTQFVAFFMAAAWVSARGAAEPEAATPRASESRAALDPRPTGGVA